MGGPMTRFLISTEKCKSPMARGPNDMGAQRDEAQRHGSPMTWGPNGTFSKYYRKTWGPNDTGAQWHGGPKSKPRPQGRGKTSKWIKAKMLNFDHWSLYWPLVNPFTTPFSFHPQRHTKSSKRIITKGIILTTGHFTDHWSIRLQHHPRFIHKVVLRVPNEW